MTTPLLAPTLKSPPGPVALTPTTPLAPSVTRLLTSVDSWIDGAGGLGRRLHGGDHGAAATDGAAALVHMDAVGEVAGLVEVRHVAVAVDRVELQAQALEPGDVGGHRGGVVLDEILIDKTLALQLPRLEVLLGRVVLVLRELLLLRRAGRLDHAARERGAAARDGGLLEHDDRGACARGLDGGREAGAAAAHDDDVRGLVPRHRCGLSRACAERPQDAARQSGAAGHETGPLEKVTPRRSAFQPHGLLLTSSTPRMTPGADSATDCACVHKASSFI